MGTCLVSNPPYNMRWRHPALASFMPEYQGWTMPPEKNANYAFLLVALSMIDDKAALLLPNSVLNPSDASEKRILQELVHSNVISAVITLPGDMFESTSIGTCILLLDKNRKTRRITLIDLREHAVQETRKQNGQFGGSSHTGRTYEKTVNVIEDTVMLLALNAIQNLTDETGFSVCVSPETVEENDCILSPSRYIDQGYKQPEHRPYKDIAADYNRIIRYKNMIKITINKTAAKRLGFDCMDHTKPDLNESFALVGEKAEKENFIRFSASDGIEIRCSTKDEIPSLIKSFLYHWKDLVIHLNNEENRLLAEFRDALLPDLMSGKIEVKEYKEDK